MTNSRNDSLSFKTFLSIGFIFIVAVSASSLLFSNSEQTNRSPTSDECRRTNPELTVYLKAGDYIVDLSLPQELLDKSLLHNIQLEPDITNVREYFQHLNASKPPHQRYLYVEFCSQLKSCQHNSKFVVYIPGNPEKWILFNRVTKSGIRFDELNAISVIAVQTQPDGTRIADGEDFYLEKKANMLSTKNTLMKPPPYPGDLGARNCLNCHATGLRSLVPFPNTPFDKYAIQEMNKTMKPVDFFGRFFRPVLTGPPMGTHLERSPEFIKKCMQVDGIDTLTTQEVHKLEYTVRQSMNCVECHEGKSAVVLNYPMGLAEKEEAFGSNPGALVPFLSNHIRWNNMPRPQKIPLTSIEKKALINCLITEYYGTPDGSIAGSLKEWQSKPLCR